MYTAQVIYTGKISSAHLGEYRHSPSSQTTDSPHEAVLVRVMDRVLCLLGTMHVFLIPPQPPVLVNMASSTGFLRLISAVSMYAMESMLWKPSLYILSLSLLLHEWILHALVISLVHPDSQFNLALIDLTGSHIVAFMMVGLYFCRLMKLRAGQRYI